MRVINPEGEEVEVEGMPTIQRVAGIYCPLCGMKFDDCTKLEKHLTEAPTTVKVALASRGL